MLFLFFFLQEVSTQISSTCYLLFFLNSFFENLFLLTVHVICKSWLLVGICPGVLEDTPLQKAKEQLSWCVCCVLLMARITGMTYV